MIIDALHAWVLHKRWIGDTSALVTFFTFEQGIITSTCKGGRTPKKQALLQEFTPLWLAINQQGNHCYVRQIEMMTAPLQLTGHGLFAALYVNELLYYFLRPNDESAKLYKAYESLLNALLVAQDRIEIEMALRRFEWMLLVCCGYSMSLTYDIDGRLILADRCYQLLNGEGFVEAKNGVSGRHIIAFSQDKFDDVETLKAVKWMMRRTIEFVLDGKPIRSRKLYQSLRT
ncbi:DNA repair protein RecO [Legionella oakridgensis]|uniref:DNA repair protein RecO n=2 Tax=Legionella oakridgensis TaxID=29423 RepID=W0BE90_9GAMM|nr:DNA repair protein RecO [Legionella oakridgensis]AHE66729.1 DNA repair protein RecO [Legionella oakridgensis ATCC 33761 = DSM 21215]ETO93596.1 DNA replication and repair protein RecO [Legionella oakridgensis RV-2-2007]KTD38101.1 DNA repair protein RecO [Legionella oakridgensis]STY19861.1 DNA repair protein RecO [Legionella longbeachae]